MSASTGKAADSTADLPSNGFTEGSHAREIADDRIPAMIGYWDRNLRNRFGNSAYAQWFGIDPSTMPGMHIREVIGEERYQLNLPYLSAVLNGQEQQFERAIPTPDGKQVRHSLAQYIPDIVEGQVQGFYAIVIDITFVKKSETALQENIRTLKLHDHALNQISQSVMITDVSRMLTYVNDEFERITGYSRQEVLGRRCGFLQGAQTQPEMVLQIRVALANAQPFQGEILNYRKDGTPFWNELFITPAFDSQGRLSQFVGVMRDITERKRADKQIQSLSFSDPLTGLPNRRYLLDRLQQSLDDVRRHQCHGALLFVDLDDFKTLNDARGHDAGDRLLVQVAKRLQTCIRTSDILGRFSGDKFVILMNDLSSDNKEAIHQAGVVGEKILTTLDPAYQLDEVEHQCSASIGITLFAAVNENTAEPLKQAETAMYKAKAAGRNTLRFFDPEMQAVVSARMAMEADLREAILNGRFRLHYQAQVTDKEQIIGVEALLRWLDPKRGMVSPAEFIPVAEETGLVLPIGNGVLETACRQLALWADKPALEQLSIAVNVSARQFRESNFVDRVLSTLVRTGAKPQRLKLELTESIMVADADDVIVKMNALKAKGIGFAIDDFGTGYSSLAYLKRLPLDRLKIDQGFVQNILIDEGDAAIARAVIAMATSMGMGVIAEGVETEAQREFLAALGCHDYQGYLFSRPLPAEEFEALVARTSVRTSL